MDNGWSRTVLEHQIGSDLYDRQGKAITNFQVKLPEPQSDLAEQTLKNPYNFDFLTLREEFKSSLPTIEKIENERTMPHPDEVLVMAQKYKQPSLCNYYCANQCPIGAQYVPEIKVKDLSQIVLEMLASLNSMQKEKDRLIEITVDGKVSGDELADFVAIQEQLEKISVAVETLQLWCERMLATGAIDPEAYQAYRDAMRADQG